MSGFEVANRRNSWETFKLLLSYDTHHQLVVPVNSNFSKSLDTINLIVSVEDIGVGIALHASRCIFTLFMQIFGVAHEW